MEKPTVGKFKTIKQAIRNNKTFKLIRGIVLGLFYLFTIFRISLTVVMMITTHLVLNVGYGQSGDLPVRKDDPYTAIRYWYDEQGRLTEEVHFRYTTLSARWPLTLILPGMTGDEIKLIWPFPHKRELWVYEENSLNKTQYVYDAYWPTEKNLGMVLTYKYELDEQGRIVFADKKLRDYHRDPYYYIHPDYYPNTWRYEYDINGNISILYDLNANGDVYQYYVHSYENDLLVREDHYFIRNNQFSSYELYYYDSKGLLIKHLSHWDSNNIPNNEATYEYDEEGRLIFEYERYRYFY